MKVLVKCIAGSHLFGLNTPTSDKDYKGVYMPEPKDIILNKIKNSINKSTNPTGSKNGADDIDSEFYSFNKFIKMLQEGQTVALELLFTPEHQILEKSELWDKLVASREQFLHKRVTAFIGYAKQQADKYGIRGSRMNAMKAAVELLNADFDDKTPLSEIRDSVEIFVKFNEHTDIIQIPANKNMQNSLVDHWEICGRKFDFTNKINHVRGILQKIYSGYGERSKQAAANNGIDWKAVSHAVRVCAQGIELLENHKITLPLEEPHRSLILDIKQGKLHFDIVRPIVEDYMNKLTNAVETSTLPDVPDREYFDEWIYNIYKQEILEQN